MNKHIIRSILILVFIMTICLSEIFGINKTAEKSTQEDTTTVLNLPTIEISDSFITPEKGIVESEARKLIINKLKQGGVKGDINAALQINEITIKELWENAGVQLYKANLEYAWINGVALIKNKEAPTILSGMPTESIFLADLDNDNLYEIYTNVFIGSGIVSEEILGYNIGTKEFYNLSMRGEYNIHLFVEKGFLMSKIRPFNSNSQEEYEKPQKVIITKDDNKKKLELEK